MSKDSRLPLPNPALQAALNSLDVDLEQEILRYRRRQKVQKASDRGLLAITSSLPATSIGIGTATPNRLNPEFSPSMAVAGSLKPSVNSAPKSAGRLSTTESTAAPPNDYLASSEQLLRSLEEEPRSLSQGKGVNWLNPLGLAALVVLLLSGVALSYVLYPNLWTDLVGGKSETPNASTSSTASSSASGTPTSNKNQPANSDRAVSAPNLAANSDFEDLNLQNLSTVKTTPSIDPKTNPKPISRALPQNNPAANRGGGNRNPQKLVSTLLPPQQSSPNRQPTAAIEPERSPSGLPRLGRPAPNGRIYYYVVTNYTNNRSLVQGRGIARDAFIVPASSGKKVQIATFVRKADADLLVRKLKNRRIPAQVYMD
jgi:hypothetical protein